MRLYIVDVFAETRYAGNQLAVVRDCAGLSDDAMQMIAREMNFSETTFVVAESESRAKVRIFTPGNELPFAGHPTIGTAWVLGHQRASYVLELAVGDVEVRLDGAAGIAWMTPPKPMLGDRFPPDRAARLLGLVSTDLAADLPAQIVAISLEGSVFTGSGPYFCQAMRLIATSVLSSDCVPEALNICTSSRIARVISFALRSRLSFNRRITRSSPKKSPASLVASDIPSV